MDTLSVDLAQALGLDVIHLNLNVASVKAQVLELVPTARSERPEKPKLYSSLLSIDPSIGPNKTILYKAWNMLVPQNPKLYHDTASEISDAIKERLQCGDYFYTVRLVSS